MTGDYQLKAIPDLRLAGQRETLDPKRMSALIGPLFDQVRSTLEAAGHDLSTPVATYLMGDAGVEVVVGYAYDGPADGPGLDELEIIDVPGAPEAVCIVHEGSMDDIQASWEALFRWVDDNNLRPAAACREVYLRADSEDQHDWLTELQQPVERR